MAKPTTYAGSTVAIFLEGATAGQYARPCGLTSHTVTFTSNTNEIQVPDCDDPELPAWIERGIESLSLDVSGSGVLAREALQIWWGSLKKSIKARIYIGAATDVSNGHYWEGNVILTKFAVTGERGNKAQVSVEFSSDGELTFNDVTV
ncbi:phage tail tube protein [Paenirhodobacter enshiensis]|uniref:phage tail tube protein n=1 Tax=Paenirhodobacter enshiensis TaxID=1105367 RepID=UPI0035B34392